jgi:ATP/maltotriose-dependent transcriptional regulator MalT
MLTFTGRSPAELTALHLGREQLALLDNDFATSLSEATLAREYGRQCESDGPSLGRRAARALVHAMCLSGDVTGALTRARSDCARYYTTFGMPSSRCAAWLDLAMVLALQGFLPQALTELDAAVELGRQSDSALSRARLLAYRAYLEAESGRLREATASLADARATYTTHEATLTVLFALAATKIALNAHQPGTAPEPADDWDLFRQPVPGLLLLAHAGEAAVLSGRDADRFVERLRSAGRTAPLADALADRVSALQRKDVDLAWQAAERLAGQGATMLAAQAKVEWAELGGNEPRDVLRDCYTVFQEGDAAWWMDRTRILARAHGLSMGLSRVDGPLTKREWQVVRLVGEGLSNADIAARLFLGQRTVETHLRNSYAKLGLSGRVALAQWAAAH